MLKEGKKSSAGGTFLGPVKGEGTIFELSLVSFSHRLNIPSIFFPHVVCLLCPGDAEIHQN